MKIAVCSDIHLEFGPIALENPGVVDLLILSGDILVEHDFDEWNEVQADNGFARYRSTMFHTFFQECSQQFPHVIYIAGNHEFYHGDIADSMKQLKKKLAYLPNVHVLDSEHWDYKDECRFIGGTLWTNMNKEDPLTLYQVKSYMNDFRLITNCNTEVNYRDSEGKFRTRIGKFSPEDSVLEHKRMLQYIEKIYDETPPWMKIVVVGHHAPSIKSIHPKYADDQVMNGAYYSELSEFILDRPGIKLWTHGHMHDPYDYMIGECRVFCNPRGYVGHEQRATDFELKVVEL